MKLYLTIFSILLIFMSCEDLEITPSDRISDKAVWDKPETADLFLNDIYNSLNAGPWVTTWTNLPSEISNDPLSNFTDNSTYGPLSATSSGLFNNASYGPSNPLFSNQWKNMYANIRKCNLFIEKITASIFDDATKKGMVAQARFLRVYFYRQLIDLYGGVPLVTKVLHNDIDGDEIFFVRSTYEDCVSFIQSECVAVAADLPLKVTGADIGRATKGAALALKGEAELYAGKWADAVATHQQIMDFKVYSLFPDYVGLFYADNENNQEVIFDIQFAPELKTKKINQYWGAPMIQKGAGWGGCDPTQNLVDCYEFKDGKTEAEGSALFDPQHPYSSRDKRFYASIIYDGSVWRGDIIYTRLGIPNNFNEINIVGKGGNAGRTGYFMKKLQDSTISSTPSSLDGTNVIVSRYAEVLLNYAEAKNELSGPDQSIYDAINDIRTRVGQPDLPTELGKDEMRTRIRNERRVELAFEGKYFYDMRRWRTSEQVFSKPVYGMKITSLEGALVYEKIPVRTVIFDPTKGYLMPIPQYAMDTNTKLIQNPGYE